MGGWEIYRFPRRYNLMLLALQSLFMDMIPLDFMDQNLCRIIFDF